jgi:hypothetical protein
MTRRCCLMPLALAVAIGCGPRPEPVEVRPVLLPEVRSYRAPALARAGRLRVLVLPFRHTDRDAVCAVTEAFTLELAKGQAFEVVPADGAEARVLERLAVWDGDCLDVHALTVLRRRLKVDALVCGKLLRYRPYSPPILGLRAQVVSTRTGSVLWGAEGTFDAGDAGVQFLMQQYHDLWLEDAPRSLGWRVLLHSPRRFNQFVAHELVATIRPQAVPTVAANPE